MQIVLYWQNRVSSEAIPVTGERFVIGSDSEADWTPPEKAGIAGWHAAIHRAGDQVWLESFAEPTLVNGSSVPVGGALLEDQAEVRLGEQTRLIVRIESSDFAADESIQGVAPPPRPQSSLPVVAVVMLALAMLTGLMVYAHQLLRDHGQGDGPQIPSSPTPVATLSLIADPPPSSTIDVSPLPPQPYRDLNDGQRRDFIKRKAQSISRLISNSHGVYDFDYDSLTRIKHHLDGYSRRWGKGFCENPMPTDCRNPRALFHKPSCYFGNESLFSLYRRASCRAPLVIQAFKQHDVPEIVGLYVVVIETEYHNLGFENFAEAMGMFQFIRGTAKQYGVQPENRGDAPRMADASARYFKDLIADFGQGQMSVPLAIAAYNRGTGNIYSDLKRVLSNARTERSFWELMRNPDRLPAPFRETLEYVPKFFAAAIVGENPEAFALELRPLSNYNTWPDSR